MVDNKEMGFSLGVDDYMLKPIERGNFVTRFAGGDSRNRCINRLHALLERIEPSAAPVRR